MFDHSVKVPRLYKMSAKLAKDVSEGRGSIKQLVYECKHPNLKALYALVVHVYQRSEQLEILLKKSKILTKEPRFDPWLAKILITELLWGKKRLSGQSKPVKTILAYEQILKAHLSDDVQEESRVDLANRPRYVRINTLKISTNEAIENFRDEGWVLRPYLNTDYLGFLQAVSNLGPEEFMVDFHIPYLLIFPAKTQFYKHQAYIKGSIILQDKASCLPAHILNPEPGSTLLDMCAAPGMKATQSAAILNNTGQIYAVEIGKKRFQTLEKIIESAGASCIKTLNADVLTLRDAECPNTEYILVDPSCSGSGITDRVEIGQQESQQHEYRLEKLAGFQIKILRHALTQFPHAKRVAYSTCSMYPEENEDVVRQVLETCTQFKLVPAEPFLKGKWINFGSSDFGDIGKFCLYSKPDIDLTSGFFVAVFERLGEGERNPLLNARLFSLQKKHLKARKRERGWERNNEEGEADNMEIKDVETAEEHVEVPPKKKKIKVKIENETKEEPPKEKKIKVKIEKETSLEGGERLKIKRDKETNLNVAEAEAPLKKKKSKKSIKDVETTEEIIPNDEIKHEEIKKKKKKRQELEIAETGGNIYLEVKKKKAKKHKHNENEDITVDNIADNLDQTKKRKKDKKKKKHKEDE